MSTVWPLNGEYPCYLIKTQLYFQNDRILVKTTPEDKAHQTSNLLFFSSHILNSWLTKTIWTLYLKIIPQVSIR